MGKELPAMNKLHLTHLFQSAYDYGTGWAGYDSQVQPSTFLGSKEIKVLREVSFYHVLTFEVIL